MEVPEDAMQSTGLDHHIHFRLPVPGWPRITLASTFTFDRAELAANGVVLLSTSSRAELEAGVKLRMPKADRAESYDLEIRLEPGTGQPQVQILVDGKAALREDRLRARPSQSAWLHAWLALAGSGAGFVASWLYLVKAQTLQSPWALKMGNHMAGWHLLLTFCLFPASVWGQRVGIRSVQAVSLLFFLIHLGIAIANLGPSDPNDPNDGTIAFFNALSGIFFLITAVYGNRAHADMDPCRSLSEGEGDPGLRSD
jgi:hypothetical protein